MSDVVLRTIDPNERDAVLDLLAEWYNDREFFARYLLHDPTFTPDLCFVAEVEGKLISTFQVFRKQIRLDSAVLDVAGVGNVFTTPAYRGRSIASRLLEFGIAQLPRHGFDVSLLFAVRIAFYARLGYRSHLRYLFYFPPSGPCREIPRYNLRPFTASDLPAVQQIYDGYSSRFRGPTLRNPAYWAGQLRYAGNPSERFLVAEQNGEVVAYARATNLWDFYVVSEYGCRAGHLESLVALLLQHQAEGSQNYPGMLVQLAHDPALLQQLEQHGLVGSRIDDVFWMWRVVSPEQFAAKLGVTTAALQRMELWQELFPPESTVYWISDRF
ncbi:MAG: GNAT family N-acetyltransferase [Candidatus Binatia bacterium]|nr:GNAT family N-acetyltransferase [Candidatus Binatia bacterium]